jgi:signal transduction histidine kinase/DNA-binding response OmpR family regulator
MRIPSTHIATFALLFISAQQSLICQKSRLLKVPERYRSIQSAINAARVGDTVLVDHGIYYENVRINKNIVLASRFILDGDTSHISHTIIDGSRPRDILTASTVTFRNRTDTSCVLLGFTIQGGTGTYEFVPGDLGSEHWFGGGGVCLLNAGGRIAHNIIRDNMLTTHDSTTFVYGAGISTLDAVGKRPLPPFLIIEQNTVVGNSCSGHRTEAAGVWVGQPAIVRHNIIVENRASSRSRSFGGGIYVSLTDAYDVAVEGNYICRNAASIGGGALITCAFVRRGRTIFSNNIIANNEAFEVGGAVNIAEESYAIFVNNTIVQNKGLASGGGINVTSAAHAVLVNNIIWQNAGDQVSIWGIVQAWNNLVEGGIRGRDNLDQPPMFLPGDSLFRLSPNSPGIGTGIGSFRLADRDFFLPNRDFRDMARPDPSGSDPDLGASETSAGLGAASLRIRADRLSESGRNVKVTVIIRQLTPAVRTPETREIVRAGQMSTTVVVNDRDRRTLDSSSSGVSVALPAGRNNFEVEILSRARDTTKGLIVYYHLEGLDPHVSILREKHGSAFQTYSDLKPGTYHLILQPQDDSRIIGHTNRVSIEIIVLPFWYQRWWAYGLFAAGVIFLAVVFVNVQARKTRLEHALALQRLKSEKLGELDRAKSRFFANLSHEFRTPLTLILGPADQLESVEKELHKKEQLGVIRRNAERLLRMVNQLLQFARIESGTMKLRVSLQPIPPLLKRIASSFSTAAVKKGVALSVEIEPTSFQGYLDTEKIEHIVENLLSNAIKYTHAGGRVDLAARRVGTDLIVTVSDTGVGIKPEDLGHVFERFYRADASHQTEGTGIGLSLTKELVEFHRGSITLVSTHGKGTRATVKLPISGYADSEIAQPSQTRVQVGSKETIQAPTIIQLPPLEQQEQSLVLVVEDNDEARAYLRSRFAPEFEVMEAATGAEALERAQERVPDIVVSDVMMPEMNGYELCKLLKTDVRTSHIPVILLTALADQTDRLVGLETGADDYLVKPFDAHELVVRVRNLIANRKKVQERFRTVVPLKPGEVKVESLDDAFLRRAIEAVERRMSDEKFDVELLAHEMFLSRGQLHRKLRALTNISPTDFIRSLRLQRARDLLEKGAGTVGEIAYRVGFSNHPYFSQCFKEQFGLMPTEVARR